MPIAVVDELAAVAEPGLTAMGSGRYFGFVIGGALPASLAADWLVSAWDQNAGLAQPTPAVSALEAVTGRWVLELLGLPAHSSFAFVTGCQMAHVTSLAAARQAVYERIGYDLREQGLAGAPPLRVVVGEKRHVTLTRALRLLGIGRAQELVVPVDDQGRMRAELLEGVLADAGQPLIVCAQAGEVNTGAFDDLETIVAVSHAHGRLGPRRRRVRPLGRGEPTAGAPRPGSRRSRLVGHRRPQVAQRPVRLRDRDLRPPGDARGGDGVRRPVPGRRRRGRARPDGLQPRVLAPRALVARVGRDPLARAPRLAELIEGSCASAVAIAEGLAALPGLRDPQRRRAQPGAAAVRDRRADDARSSRPCSRRARRG